MCRPEGLGEKKCFFFFLNMNGNYPIVTLVQQSSPHPPPSRPFELCTRTAYNFLFSATFLVRSLSFFPTPHITVLTRIHLCVFAHKLYKIIVRLTIRDFRRYIVTPIVGAQAHSGIDTDFYARSTLGVRR